MSEQDRMRNALTRIVNSYDSFHGPLDGRVLKAREHNLWADIEYARSVLAPSASELLERAASTYRELVGSSFEKPEDATWLVDYERLMHPRGNA